MTADKNSTWGKEMAIEKLNTMLIDHEKMMRKIEPALDGDIVINSRGKLIQYVKSLIMKEDGVRG